MTTHDTDTRFEDVEARLRASLADRADDVDSTPALYERVQRQATRGTWLRRGLALAGAAAAVAGVVAVAPQLLPDQPLQPDVLDTPSPATAPGDGPATADGPDGLVAAGIAWSDGRMLHLPDREIDLGDGAEDVALSTTGGRVATVTSGFVRIHEVATAESGEVLTASPGVDRVALSPDGRAVAWVDGTELVVHPDATARDGRRTIPLTGEVREGLRLEQWIVGDGVQVLLASHSDGGVWSIQLDGDAPLDAPAEVTPIDDAAGAVDIVALPSVAPLVLLEVDPDGAFPARLRPVGDVDGFVPTTGAPLPPPLDTSTALALHGNGGWSVTVTDTVTGDGALLHLDATGRYRPLFTWDAAAVRASAAVPLTVEPDAAVVRDIATEDQLDEVTDADGAIGDVAPGQPVPLVGSFADGLQIAELDGSITELRAFDGPDSEAFIGVLDVRPGGSRGDFTLAYEHIAEGETSIRFLRVRGDEVTPVGATEVTGNEGQRLTSLTWSPDGRQVASTHEVDGGIEVLSLTEDLEFAGRFRRLSTVPGGAVVDWRWRSLSDDGAEGHFVVQVGGPAGRTQQIAVTRTGDVQTNFPEGDDLEPVPGMAVAVGDSERETIDLVLRTEDGGLSWTWGNIGDAFGDLVVPDRLGTNPGLWSGLRTTAHAGSAVVQHDDGAGAWWLRLVGQRGELVELNNGVSWTPVG